MKFSCNVFVSTNLILPININTKVVVLNNGWWIIAFIAHNTVLTYNIVRNKLRQITDYLIGYLKSSLCRIELIFRFIYDVIDKITDASINYIKIIIIFHNNQSNLSSARFVSSTWFHKNNAWFESIPFGLLIAL